MNIYQIKLYGFALRRVKLFYSLMVIATLLISSLMTSAVADEKKPKSANQWIHSDQLKPGMKIITADNRVLTVLSEWKQTPEPVTTYNFEVAGNHTYFVSQEKLWVHNMADCDKKTIWEKLKDRVFRKKTPAVETTAYKIPNLFEVETQHFTIQSATNVPSKIRSVSNPDTILEGHRVTLNLNTPRATSETIQEIASLVSHLNNTASRTGQPIWLTLRTTNPQVISQLVNELRVFKATGLGESSVVLELGVR